jgi:TctA family transporter
MFDAFFSGLIQVLMWPAIGYMFIGILLGIWLGAVPGIGGLTGLAILIPFTFDMDPVPAFAMLLGMIAVTNTSDSVTAILLGVPGSSAAQATIMDGHPLAPKGEANRAMGAAFAASAFGGVFGAIALAISMPVALPIILAIGQPETFAFGVLGLSLVASLAGSSIYKGLAAGTFGLLLSAVGYAEASAIPRYNFGTDYLLDNLPFLPLILGLFAIPELMELATGNTSISRVQEDQSKSTMWQGVRDTWTHIWLNIRCCIIGVYIGILPGLGGSVADWLAYGHAKQSAKDNSQFGKGDIRGVIGPESCNNAVLGGSLIPTVAFGIPGGAGMAILLGAFLIQGLRPGPEMLTTKLDITFSMVWTVAIANIIVAIMMMAWARQVAKLAFTPGYYIVPGVILFVFMGAWLSTTSVGDWVLCIVFGIIGYIMKRGGWARPPIILGYVLGEIMENAYVISIRAYDGYGWLLRPITLLIFAGAVLTVLLSARGILKMKRAGIVTEEGAEEGSMRNSVLSFPFAIMLSATFLYAIAATFEWTKSVRMFPLTVAIPGAIFALIAVFYDWRSLRRDVATAGSFRTAARAASEKAELTPSLWFFAMLIALLIVMLLIGMKFAIPLYVLVFLLSWGKVKWRYALIYAGVCYAFLVGFYDQVLHTSWYPSMLFDLLAGRLPDWLPEWLIL